MLYSKIMKECKLLLLFCILGFAAGAQVTVEKSSVTFSGMPSLIHIRVLDAADDNPLAGAHVKIIFASGDTVTMATDNSGNSTYTKRFPTDSLSLVISHIGYKTIFYSYKPESSYAFLTVRLLEDIIEMNAIIIKGERIAMVVKGDTTFYNASAFKTMRGDNVEELLKKLPGVEFRDGRFFANGEPVNRILINGTELFGTDTDAAGRLIRADEVKNVKVYDYYSNKRRYDGDTLDVKERVLDVTTHEKIDVVKSLSIEGSVGQYMNKNEADSYDPLYTVIGGFSRFKVGKRFMAQLDYDKNAGIQRSGYSENWTGRLIWDTPDTSKVTFRTNTTFNDKTTNDRFSSDRSYFSSLAYNTRNYVSELLKESYDRSLNSRNSLKYRINKKNIVWLSLDATYTKNRFENTNLSVSTTDGLITESMHMHQYDAKKNFGINSALLYRHKFRLGGRFLELSTSYSFGNDGGDGWTVDTLASSISRIFLTNDKDGWNRNYSFVAEYDEPIAKNLYMTLKYTMDDTDRRSKRIVTDMLLHRPDTLNTYDYTLRNITHSAGIHFNYRKDKVGLNIGTNFQSFYQRRDEVFPQTYTFPRTFNHILLWLSFSYEIPLSRLNIDYRESVEPLSVEELRGVIDNTNTLFLKAGNPDSKPGVTRNIHLTYDLTSVVSASSLNLVLDASFVSGYLARKTRYFSQPTGLSEYNYTAATGTSLETNENVKGKWTLNADVNYSKNSALLESTLRTMLKYRYDRTPFFLSDDLYATDAHSLSATLAFQSGFSRFIEIYLTSTTGGAYSRDDNNHTYKSFRQSGYGRVRINFLKRYWLTGSTSYHYEDYITSDFTREETLLSASFLYKFGKNDQGEIGLHVDDILNQQKSISIMMQEDYIETSRSRILGRNASISFSYQFK